MENRGPLKVFGAPVREQPREEAAGAIRAVFFIPPEPAEAVLSKLRHCAQNAGL